MKNFNKTIFFYYNIIFVNSLGSPQFQGVFCSKKNILSASLKLRFLIIQTEIRLRFGMAN